VRGRTPSQARVSAAALAAFIAGAQLLAVAHMSVVVHAVCAEHGELVHAAGPEAEQLSAAADRELHAAPAADGGHEHCAVAACRRQPVELSERFSTEAVVAAVAEPIADTGADVFISRLRLLQAAPKASPPCTAV
jgi:hypothetical protein